MTAVTRAADAPRAASAISSSSKRFSWTGGTSGWIRNTSRSRQLDCIWTSMQSFANRVNRTGSCGSDRHAQISAASAGWARPPNTAISRTPHDLRGRNLGPASVRVLALARVLGLAPACALARVLGLAPACALARVLGLHLCLARILPLGLRLGRGRQAEPPPALLLDDLCRPP